MSMSITWPTEGLPKFPLSDFFVGRERELDFLSKQSQENNSAIYVSGSGGIGKTALLRFFGEKYADLFPGGVFHFNAHRTNNLQEEISKKTISAKKQLFTIDDIEYIEEKAIHSLISFAQKFPNATLVLSGRKKIAAKVETIKVIELGGLNNSEVVRARLQYFPDAEISEKILKTIDGNPLLLQILANSPREILLRLQQTINSEEKALVDKKIYRKTEQKFSESESGACDVDIVGILIAILFFVFSQFSGDNSEARLSSEIQELKGIVSQQTAEATKNIPKEKAPSHFINEFVRLRLAPSVDSNNVITVLFPNQQVRIINVSEGWAFVEFYNHISKATLEGYVYSKYLSQI